MSSHAGKTAEFSEFMIKIMHDQCASAIPAGCLTKPVSFRKSPARYLLNSISDDLVFISLKIG
jgi:hypothetical protein